MTETALQRIKNRGLNDYGEVPLQYADYLALLAVVEAAQEVKRLGEGNVPSEELIAAVDVMYEKLDLLHGQASDEGKA